MKALRAFIIEFAFREKEISLPMSGIAGQFDQK